MQTDDHESLRARLLKEREGIRRRAVGLWNKQATVFYDVVDEAADSTELRLRTSLSLADVSTLRQIEHALRRMSEGTYGTCVVCGVEISMRRLKILPYTAHCAQCGSNR